MSIAGRCWTSIIISAPANRRPAPGIIILYTMDLHADNVARASVQMAHTQYKTLISSGKHSIVADEPETLQGTDEGMSPMNLLLASLGSCTAITLRMYINRKMWVVEEININLALYKVEGGTMITREIITKGNLSEEQKKRLEQIADACPVHKMLVGAMMVETRML